MPFFWIVYKTPHIRRLQKKLANAAKHGDCDGDLSRRSVVKARPGKLRTRLWCAVAFAGLVASGFSLHADEDGQKGVDAVRQQLRDKGFKTDLSDFDFSTPPEMRDREAVLFNTDRSRLPMQLAAHPNLLEPIGSNTAVVVWKLKSVKRQEQLAPDEGNEMTWDEFRAAVRTNQIQFDAACAAILAGPMRYNLIASHGSELLLPHLSMLKNLETALGSRVVLALHDGDMRAAWTNILAASRLVTAWDVEPVEISEFVRAENASQVFAILWQALQTNGWPDDELALLQSDWEAVNFFAAIPGAAAFRRASDVALCEKERKDALASRQPFSELFNNGDQPESPGPAELDERWKQMQYAEHGSFEDQKALLLFYRDRELELRDAIRSPTWAAMSRLGLVTNAVHFKSQYHSMLQARIQQRDLSMSIQSGGAGLLGAAARAEAERRVIITAIALERYRARHGNYPGQLASLTPEFLKQPLPDFIDGKPLRYRPMPDDRFLLYSIGLDGVDDGGQMERRERPNFAELRRGRGSISDKGDLVWPLPAQPAEVEAIRAEERKALELQAEQAEDMQAENQWNHTARHQADAEKLLSGPAAQNVADPKFHGKPLSEVLRSPATGTNRLTLGEMLTLKQIQAGGEPETVTFELPISFDAMANIGRPFLYIDVNNDRSEEGCNVQQMDLKRADNGNCRLVWSTIYESPGKHMLQAGLLINELASDNTELCGPYLPFTISNFCQFTVSSATFDPRTGALFHAKLIEKNAKYSIDMVTTNGVVMKTISNTTTNGIIKFRWDLIDSKGVRFAGDEFNSVIHITLPDSGRSQTMKGP